MYHLANWIVRTARELTLEAAQSAASNRPSSADPSSRSKDSVPHIKKLLDSRHEREVLDGMRKVISVWRDTSLFT